jgi:hypothetical protein
MEIISVTERESKYDYKYLEVVVKSDNFTLDEKMDLCKKYKATWAGYTNIKNVYTVILKLNK